MPKFDKGDVVEVDGQQMTVEYWPWDDQGFASLTTSMKDGGKVFHTKHVGDLAEPDYDPVTEVTGLAGFTLVAKAEGVVSSTAGDVPVLEEDDEDVPAVEVKRGPGRPRKEAA